MNLLLDLPKLNNDDLISISLWLWKVENKNKFPIRNLTFGDVALLDKERVHAAALNWNLAFGLGQNITTLQSITCRTAAKLFGENA